MKPALCVIMTVLIAAQGALAQAPQKSEKPPTTEVAPNGLKIWVIEGNNAINSIPLGRSVTPVIEVRDQNDFPVEGATVVFTMPENGPGGAFLATPNTYTTRTDAHGQASAPFTVNSLPGKFQIGVAAIAGNRTGEAAITQTNTIGGYIGPEVPRRSWYKRWPTWAIIGSAVTAGIIVWAVDRGSGSSSPSTLPITPGTPVFH